MNIPETIDVGPAIKRLYERHPKERTFIQVEINRNEDSGLEIWAAIDGGGDMTIRSGDTPGEAVDLALRQAAAPGRRERKLAAARERLQQAQAELDRLQQHETAFSRAET